ncbi:hypothetical protein BGZ98_004303 [Dissophora globulifera]|nr:hypothetical protein BGZ98_004303 [Dissophora globulifera]
MALRGRLPDATHTHPLYLSTIHIIDPATGLAYTISGPSPPLEEETSIQQLLNRIDRDLTRSIVAPLDIVAPHVLPARERTALLGIARIVQQDMRALQHGLSRAGRPPDQRDGEYVPAPDWDIDYLDAMIDDWNQPVLLESDFYLLRAMSLYALGISVQVKVLGPDKVDTYLDMAMTLAQRALCVLQSVVGHDEDAVDKYWRYPMIISYIQQHQALRTIEAITEHESITSLPASDQLYEKARQQLTRALEWFDRGVRFHPNISSSPDPFKDQEWVNMAELTDSYAQLAKEFLVRQTWAQHTIRLFEGALHENTQKRARYLQEISTAHLSFAMWIYEQPEKPLLLFPKVSPMFIEMQRAAISALVYAKQSFDSLQQDETQPEHYCQIIDSLYMMSLVCVATRLIHGFSRKASYWISELKAKFPDYKIQQAYLYSARLMDSKDKVMQEIAEQRQKQRQDQ